MLRCHIRRDAAHVQADTSRKKPKEFPFDAAFTVSKDGSGEIWVGLFKTQLTRDNCKHEEVGAARLH